MTMLEVRERPIPFTGEMIRAILADRKTQTRRVCKDAHDGESWAASVHQDGSGTGWIAWWPNPVSAEATAKAYPGDEGFRCPYGVPGDRLYVKEAWQTGSRLDSMNATQIAEMSHDAGWTQPAYCPVRYPLDGKCTQWGDNDARDFGDWGRIRTSRFMPKWVARLWLEVTDVRVQRVREITREDVRAEGTPGMVCAKHQCEHCNGSGSNHTWPDGCPHCEPKGSGLNHTNHFRRLWDSINAARGYAWKGNPWVWCLTVKRA